MPLDFDCSHLSQCGWVIETHNYVWLAGEHTSEQ